MIITRGLRFALRVTVPLAVCCLLAALPPLGRGQDKSQLAGQWNLNQDQSDDARAKIRAAQGQRPERRRRSSDDYPGGNYPSGGGYPGGGYPGGGYPGGGYPSGGIGGPLGRHGGGYPGGGHRGGMGAQNRGLSGEEWERLSAQPKVLRIESQGKQFVISDDSGLVQTLYPDGKKHTEKDVNGNKTATKTQWQGSQLVVESKVGHSGKLTESYRISPDGKQLFVISRLEDPALTQPLSLQRVYDRAGTQPPASNQ
jgi:hypothetical protein